MSRKSIQTLAIMSAFVLGAFGAVACGDDEKKDDKKDAGTGGDGDGDGDKTGDGDGDGDGDKTPTKESCLEDGFAGVGNACLECTCTALPKEISECDEMCWNLIRCSSQNGCTSLPDSERTNCAVANCGDYILAGTQAVAAGPAVQQCATQETCLPFLLEGASVGDAGTGDAGTGDAGGDGDGDAGTGDAGN